ncbi:MAG: hypothetical protein ACOCR1_01475, partial [Planctomycetota bacterium]
SLQLELEKAKTRRQAREERKTARRLFKEAKKAYRNGEMEQAVAAADEAEKYEGEIDENLSQQLQEVKKKASDAIENAESLYERAVELFEDEKYEEAREKLEEVKSLEFTLPDRISDGVDEHWQKVEKRIREQRIAEAQKFEKSVEELNEVELKERRRIERRRELKDEASDLLAVAEEAEDRDDYATARSNLKEALEELKGIDEPDEQVVAWQRQINDKLPVLDRQVKIQEARKKRENRFAELVEGAKDASEGQKQEKIREALELAAASGLSLSDEDTELAREIDRRAFDRYEKELRASNDRYAEIVKKGIDYLDKGRFEVAEPLSGVIEEAGWRFLGEEGRKRFSELLGSIETTQETQDDVAEMVKDYIENAEEALNEGEFDRGLREYRNALDLASGENLSSEFMLDMLVGYRDALEESREELMEEVVADVETKAEDAKQEVSTRVPYLLARAYIDSDCYDGVEDLLEDVKEGEGLSEDKKDWATEQLDKLEDRREELEEERLLAVREHSSRVYELREELDEVDETAEQEKVEELRQELKDARREYFVANVDFYLDRGAVKPLAKLLDDKTLLVEEFADADVIQQAKDRVQQWKELEGLVDKADRTLEEHDEEEVEALLTELERADWEGSVFEKIAPLYRKACRAVVEKEAQEQTVQTKLAEATSTVEDEISRLRDRMEAIDGYVKACALYAAGDWEAAIDALNDIVDGNMRLTSAEIKHAGGMMQIAERKLEESVAAEQKKEALEQIARASEKSEEGEYEEGLEILRDVTDQNAYERDKEVRKRTDTLLKRVKEKRYEAVANEYTERIESRLDERRFQQAAELIEEVRATEAAENVKTLKKALQKYDNTIEEAEREARKLYKAAAEAYDAGRSDELEDLLSELKNEYRHTEVYAEKM